jgi:tRNA(Arg) A34 adenosine deaminase TadA
MERYEFMKRNFDDHFFMNKAYAQAARAFKHNEVPIGGVLVDDQGNIIAQAYNQVERKQTQLAHAELLILAKAAKKMKSWRLSKTTLYVTVQPCMMCAGALFLSRVSCVIFGVASEKFGANFEMLQNKGIYKNLSLNVRYFPHVRSISQNWQKSNKICCNEKKK